MNKSKIPWDSKEKYSPDVPFNLVRPTTNIWFRWDADEKIVEARQGFQCMSDERPKSNNPFAENFYELFHSGRATTEKQAIIILKREFDSMIKMMSV